MKQHMVKVFIPLSGDPSTLGHRRLYDYAKFAFPDAELYIGLGNNTNKRYLFSFDDRMEMAQRTFDDSSLNIISAPDSDSANVVTYEGMLAGFSRENAFDVIIRGVRGPADVDAEMNIHNVGKKQMMGKQRIKTHDRDVTGPVTVFIPADQDMTDVSSSTGKEIQRAQGSTEGYFTPFVKQRVEAKISSQYFVGVMGVEAAGKSYVSLQAQKLAEKRGIPIHIIDLDYLGHEILEESTEDLYKNVRLELIDVFEEDIRSGEDDEYFIDRKKLGRIVFDNPAKMDILNEIMYEPLMYKYEKEKSGEDKKGLIFVNGALLPEFGLTYLMNHNIVNVTADGGTVTKRLRDKKGYNSDQITRRTKSQFTAAEKYNTVKDRITEEDSGEIWSFDNSEDAEMDKQLNKMLDDIILKMDIYGELRFMGLWNRIGADGTYEDEYNKLIGGYSEPHRKYHIPQHIIDMLNLFAEAKQDVGHLMTNPDATEVAIWYHDYWLKKRSRVNEKISSNIVYKVCTDARLNVDFAEDVKNRVCATRHPDDLDNFDNYDDQVIADIDTAIFGMDEDAFNKYEQQIIQEFAWADKKEFTTIRIEILEKFRKREHIFYTDYIRNKLNKNNVTFEEQARANLDMSLEQLYLNLEEL